MRKRTREKAIPFLRRGLGAIFWFATAEWLVAGRNGGSVIATRSIIISLEIFLLGIWMKSALSPNATLEPSILEFRTLASDHIEWFGAALAGAYAALYTRFSSQWKYLAELYNQIKAIQVQNGPRDLRNDRLAEWYAGFISDAVELHLCRKESFEEICISAWQFRNVKKCYNQSVQRMPRHVQSQFKAFALHLDEKATMERMTQAAST